MRFRNPFIKGNNSDPGKKIIKSVIFDPDDLKHVEEGKENIYIQLHAIAPCFIGILVYKYSNKIKSLLAKTSINHLSFKNINYGPSTITLKSIEISEYERVLLLIKSLYQLPLGFLKQYCKKIEKNFDEISYESCVL